MTENDVYLTLCDRLLEPSGLQLGVLTQAQFHNYFLDVLADFCRSTGIIKLFSTQTVNNGQAKYVFPDRLINVESVFTSGRFIPRSDLNSIDNSQFQWRNKVGPVKVFHEDGLPIKTLEAVPAPDWQGTLVTDPSGYEYLDAFSAPGTIPAAERNLTVYGSQIPTGLTVCEPSASALTQEPYGIIPPPYKGYCFGNCPDGAFGFEYNGFQYVFLHEEGSGFVPGSEGDLKIHALRSADKGLTWTELDAAHAPLPGMGRPEGSGHSSVGGGLGDYTMARDGSMVLVLSTEQAPIGRSFAFLYANTLIQVGGFNLATGLWVAPKFFYPLKVSGPWLANHGYGPLETVIDGLGHTQIVTHFGTSGGTIPTFSDSGGTVTEGTGVIWQDQGVTGGAPKWLANTEFPYGYAVVDAGGHIQVVTNIVLTGGTFNSGATIPVFNDSGGTTADNAITWTDFGVAVAGPSLDFLHARWQYLQLVVRGAGNYLLYYSGPREITSLTQWKRAYYATFNGTTFGSDTILPNQTGVSSHGLPLSACMDSAGITHFLIQLQFGPSGYNSTDCHIALTSGNVFGTMGQVTNNDVAESSSSGTVSKLITYLNGSVERLGCVLDTYDGTNPAAMRLFHAPAALNPVWVNSVIQTLPGPYSGLYIYPDNNDLIPQAVSLGFSGDRLAVIWSTITHEDNGVSAWYWSQADTATLTWSAPQVFIPEVSFLPPLWSSSVTYQIGDIVSWGDDGEGDGFPDIYTAKVVNTGQQPDVVFADWRVASRNSNRARSTQVFATPVTGGIGVVTVWAGWSDQLMAQFSFLEYSSTIGHCTQMIPDSAILYLGFGVLAKVFMDSSELKDQQKALYATSRYQEGVGLFRALMIEEMDSETE